MTRTAVWPRFARLCTESLRGLADSRGTAINAQNRLELLSLIRYFSSQPREHFLPQDGKQLSDFLARSALPMALSQESGRSAPQPKVYIETYGCQMNVSDSEIVQSVLAGEGYGSAESAEEAQVVLLNTCAIRERAEQRIWSRLGRIRHGVAKASKAQPDARTKPIVGVLGCMAERLKEDLLRKGSGVDLVVGPDAYRDLPRLLRILQVIPGSTFQPPVSRTSEV